MSSPQSSEPSTGSDVLVERLASTVLITLNRPERGNSVQGTLLGDLITALEVADRDNDVRAVVTTGAGPAYCVGADVATLTELGPHGTVDLQGLSYQGELGGDWGMPELSSIQKQVDTVGFGKWVTRFLDVDVPTVAAINGGVAGGGLSLALLHDIRIASSTAKFAPAFVALGVSPEMGLSWLLPRIVGLPKAFDILTRTRPICAAEALDLGLVEAVVEPGDLRAAALERARHFADLPAVSVRMVKRLLRQATESTLHTQLEREWHNQTRLFASADTGDTIKDYLNRL